MVKLMGKEILTVLRSNIFLSGPLPMACTANEPMHVKTNKVKSAPCDDSDQSRDQSSQASVLFLH